MKNFNIILESKYKILHNQDLPFKYTILDLLGGSKSALDFAALLVARIRITAKCPINRHEYDVIGLLPLASRCPMEVVSN